MNFTIASVQLTEQEASDILTGAIESGISTEWFAFTDIARAKDAHPDLSAGSVISATVIEREDPQNRWFVDAARIELGLNRLVAGRVQVGSWFNKQIMDDDIDAEGADCILQAGTLGEIVYS